MAITAVMTNVLFHKPERNLPRMTNDCTPRIKAKLRTGITKILSTGIG